MNHDYFELQSLSDDLVYQLDRVSDDKTVCYKRRDQDLYITYKPDFGWCAFDETTQELMGRSWQTLPQNQSPNFPPEGIWVSRKEEKSYVYQLVYKPKP